MRVHNQQVTHNNLHSNPRDNSHTTNITRQPTEWFVDRYAARGVHFDGIFAWEAAGINHNEYWSEVPARIVPIMHLYNHPVLADLLLPGQPLNVLHQIYRPGVW